MDSWEIFYKKQFSQSFILDNTQYFDTLYAVLGTDITLGELYSSLTKCKNNKCAGSDDLSNEFYKNLSPKWVHHILNMFNKIINTETIPETRSSIQVSVIHKKGVKNDPHNYRGIFTQILYSRVEP